MAQHPTEEVMKFDLAMRRGVFIHRSLIEVTGSITAAILLSQIHYWTERIPEEREGWFWKTQADWQEETGLSRTEQETARKRLRDIGMIEEKVTGMPCKLYFRLRWDNFVKAVAATHAFPEPDPEPTQPNSQFIPAHANIQVGEKLANKGAGNLHPSMREPCMQDAGTLQPSMREPCRLYKEHESTHESTEESAREARPAARFHVTAPLEPDGVPHPDEIAEVLFGYLGYPADPGTVTQVRQTLLHHAREGRPAGLTQLQDAIRAAEDWCRSQGRRAKGAKALLVEIAKACEGASPQPAAPPPTPMRVIPCDLKLPPAAIAAGERARLKYLRIVAEREAREAREAQQAESGEGQTP